MLRAIASRSADLAGLGFDRLEDLGLAVDEAAALLLDRGGDSLVAEFTYGLGEVGLTMSQAGEGDWPPADVEDSLEHLVLTSVSDELAYFERDGELAVSLKVSAGRKS